MSHIATVSTLRHPNKTRVKSAKKNTDFQPIAPVLLATRDYGLLRVNNTASTPHPKKYEGLDMGALSARLQVQQRKEMNRESSIEKNLASDFSYDSHRRSFIGHLSLGTPHPNKAVAMNPKVLKKRIDDLSFGSSGSTDSENTPILRSLRSILAGRYPQNVTDMANKKRVTLVTPRIIHRNRDETSEFNQHRQSLCKAEFTIARYGKKMSDHIMPKQTKSVTIDTNLILKDLEATEEIELYIQQLGFSGSPAASKMRIVNVNKKMLSSVKQDIAEWVKKRSTLLTTLPSKHFK
ncbi:uncharacterized protein LOC116804381 [Drosophila mojavensis]|nr:uncharacterized protein LOC116804381 [Drosophila mojavensis]